MFHDLELVAGCRVLQPIEGVHQLLQIELGLVAHRSTRLDREDRRVGIGPGRVKDRSIPAERHDGRIGLVFLGDVEPVISELCSPRFLLASVVRNEEVSHG